MKTKSFSRYYFDGAGKAVRPVIAVCLGKAALKTTGAATNLEVKASYSWIPDSCNPSCKTIKQYLEVSN